MKMQEYLIFFDKVFFIMIKKTLACTGRLVKWKLFNFIKSINTDNFEKLTSMNSFAQIVLASSSDT